MTAIQWMRPNDSKDWILLGILCASVLLLAGCSGLSAYAPATQGDLSALAEATREETESGNPMAAIVNGIATIGASVASLAYLSRRRRNSTSNDISTAQRVARGQAAIKAQATEVSNLQS